MAWEGHNDIADDAVEDDYPLGEWVHSVRRRRVLALIRRSGSCVEWVLKAKYPVVVEE